jgi:vacuolar-type H+-ATPase subunit H
VGEEDFRAIFEAERKAKEKIEAAKKEAERILEDARNEATHIKEKSKSSAWTKSDKVVEDFRAKAQADAQKQLQTMRKKDQALEKKLKARHNEAVELMVKAITR